jgi:hypothetical protein
MAKMKAMTPTPTPTIARGGDRRAVEQRPQIERPDRQRDRRVVDLVTRARRQDTHGEAAGRIRWRGVAEERHVVRRRLDEFPRALGLRIEDAHHGAAAAILPSAASRRRPRATHTGH